MKGSTDAFLGAWEKTCRDRHRDPAIFDPKGNVTRTFGGIEDRTKFFATALTAFDPGDVLAVQIGNHPDWPAILLAAWRRGVVILPLERSISEGERSRAMAVCHANAVYAFVRGCSGDDVVLIRNAGDLHQPVAWDERRPVLLKLTSGTTAAPRAIRFRSGQLLADCENICDTMGITSRDRNFGVVPISHSYGFSNLLTPLLYRGVPLVLTNDRIPRAISDALVATEPTVFAGMPVFYQSFCEFSDAPSWPSLRLCLSAGAPLSLELAERFREKFGREIHSFYGSSECGGICYVRKPPPLAGFVGQPLQGVEVELLNPNDSSSAIRVRSAAVADDYFPEPDQQRLGQGSFFPDDLLKSSAQGFRLVGRSSDVINVAGKKVNPLEVEAELLRVTGVRAAIVFGRESARRNQEVAACVVAEDFVREETLLGHCRARLSSWQVPRQIYLVPEIPVNERGKSSRRELALRFSA